MDMVEPAVYRQAPNGDRWYNAEHFAAIMSCEVVEFFERFWPLLTYPDPLEIYVGTSHIIKARIEDIQTASRLFVGDKAAPIYFPMQLGSEVLSVFRQGYTRVASATFRVLPNEKSPEHWFKRRPTGSKNECLVVYGLRQ